MRSLEAVVADGLALCSPREGACAERAVKKTLRCATRSSLITHNQQRLAVASAIYGVTAQRATLAHLCARAGLEGEACGSAAARRRLADARLLALFLLHGSPHRISRPQILAVLDPSMIVCTHDLARIKALDPATVRWPTRRIPRLALQYSLPTALVRLWASVLPLQEVETLAAACSLPGVVTLRANTMRCSRDELASQLREDGLIVSEGSLSPTALRLQGGREAWGGSVWSLRQWSAGWFELQDEGSQFIAHATRATHGEHVLDMCAGNGGKSLALAAMVGARGRVTAHDVVHTRLRALQASSVRAGVSSQVDALHTYTRLTIVDLVFGSNEEAHGESLREHFRSRSRPDVVLVDAPCTSSGVIRRHPGLRWSKQWAGTSQAAKDARALPLLQRRLLVDAASLLRDGGRLVYATCALERSQNEHVAEWFEQHFPGFEPLPFDDAFVFWLAACRYFFPLRAALLIIRCFFASLLLQLAYQCLSASAPITEG
ncbi:MAG: hypothetical protein SGPRY_001435 [Prymnesium sp.]